MVRSWREAARRKGIINLSFCILFLVLLEIAYEIADDTERSLSEAERDRRGDL